MQTRSGRRSSTHATARSTARAPREGIPRWKSERCAIRTPSSSAGSAGSGHGSVRSRNQPASKCPQATPAAAAEAALHAMRPAAPIRGDDTGRRRRMFRRAEPREAGTPEPPLHATKMPAPGPTCALLLTCKSDFELLDHRRHRDHVPLEPQLRLLEPGGDADELREVEDRHPEVLAGRGLELRLPRVEREVAERTRRDDRVRAGLRGLLDRLDQLAERGLLAGLDDR